MSYHQQRSLVESLRFLSFARGIKSPVRPMNTYDVAIEKTKLDFLGCRDRRGKTTRVLYKIYAGESKLLWT